MVRHKNRYILLEVKEIGRSDRSHLKLKEPSLYTAILKMVEKLHGDFGVAAIRAGFVAKYINQHTRTGIIRCRRGPHKLISSCIPFIKMVEDKIVSLNMLYVGATLRHCFGFLRNYQLKKFNEYCVSLNSEEEKAALREVMMSFEKLADRL
ncbi:unnamed protein product [Phaedon cochleariae]|uniref:Ribonuclease P/MRP protein subunit POP5 n=1 Tax=Phaedon cochleariae TaxID=80249 RepID=A0A9P0GSW2_PHACE|nr:unnamed protein product [Phaedon cochleariae]